MGNHMVFHHVFKHLSVAETLLILPFSFLELPMCHPCYSQGFLPQNAELSSLMQL